MMYYCKLAYSGLCDLQKMSKSERKKHLIHCKPHIINGISEIALNLRRGVIPLTKTDFHKLKKYKKPLRVISESKVPLGVRRKTIVQKGGFILPLLLKLGLPIAADFLFRKLVK